MDSYSELVKNIYSKTNPSDHSLDEQKIDSLNRKLLTTLLGIPTKFYQDKKLLDLGCGSGFPARVFVELGAQVTGIDFDKISLKIASSHITESRHRPSFHLLSLQEFFEQPQSLGQFDIISSLGVFHHTSHPIEYLSSTLEILNSGGIAIIGIGDKIASLQHLLLKLVVHKFKSRFSSVFDLLSICAPTYLERCVKYGVRDLRAVIQDQFINPVHNYIDSKSIKEVVDRSGCVILNRWPYSSGFFGDSVRNTQYLENRVTYMMISDLYSSSHTDQDDQTFKSQNSKMEKYWQFFSVVGNSISGNTEKKAQEFNDHFFQILDAYQKLEPDRAKFDSMEILPSFPSVKVTLYAKEIIQLLSAINEGSFDHVNNIIRNSQILFIGSSGLNMTYYVIEKS